MADALERGGNPACIQHANTHFSICLDNVPLKPCNQEMHSLHTLQTLAKEAKKASKRLFPARNTLQ